MIRWMLVGIAALMLAGAVGCGSSGDDDASSTPGPTVKLTASAEMAAYFTNYKQINVDAQARLSQLNGKYPLSFEGGDLVQTQQAFREYLTIFDETDDLYEALDVPEELRLIHDRILQADADASVIHHERLAELEAATSAAQVDTIFAQEERFNEAVERGDEACLQLEDTARVYGVEFELPCER
jgi:hypothetical protein